ncbi:hypothetical protein CBS115989_1072 [Aspergillus niger]|nr:hypothetical protein CBS115989_1072 [Aspergillus niger]KAI2852782.1 hypothetical protein CBS11350_415 [Aspergillus niger]KAI2855877.1 hypothetical protein CBS11232_4061 [Aspergillus niger]KAI2880015.1 hypothetical protein CBS115988_1862 [Aspergillus niger]KAI2888911.1 hypothetical protein CBS13152_6220 [Aspergillus niger]
MVSPLTTTFIQSTILNAIANILAQIIDHHRKSKSTFTPNLPALLQFITYGIIIVPPNFIWQRKEQEEEGSEKYTSPSRIRPLMFF